MGVGGGGGGGGGGGKGERSLWMDRKKENQQWGDRERVEVYYSEEKKGFTTRKLSNTNINTNRNNIISKLQWHLLIEYYLAISLGIHRWKIFVGDYRVNYKWKWKNEEKIMCHYYK